MRSRSLFPALLRRELGAGTVAAAAMVVAGSVAAASMAGEPGATANLSPLAGRLLRRFDLVVLGASAVLAALRAAVRVAADGSDGWLEPYAAAGGRRGAYVVGLAGAIALPAAGLFLVGAISHAVAVHVSAGSGELLRGLPGLAPAGILLVAVVAAHAVLVSVIVREATASVVATAVLVVAPYAAAAAAMARHDGSIPTVVRFWLDAAVPIATAGDLRETVRQVALLALILPTAVVAAGRLVGRRS